MDLAALISRGRAWLMSLLFHIMSFIDRDGPVGLAALIDKQLSALILEGDGRRRRRQRRRRLRGGRGPNGSQISVNWCPRAPFPPRAADISSKHPRVALSGRALAER